MKVSVKSDLKPLKRLIRTLSKADLAHPVAKDLRDEAARRTKFSVNMTSISDGFVVRIDGDGVFATEYGSSQVPAKPFIRPAIERALSRAPKHIRRLILG